MAQNLTQKILSAHLVSGRLVPGEEIGLRIDQTLTQDATGTMACLQFESLGVPRVKTRLSVSYVDHNMLQTGFENADDHRFLQSFAARYGIYFSRPGNGICHQVHLERFAVPGQTLLGSDSHTPTSGGMGMIAIGAGGLDVAVAMGGGPFYTTMPRIVGVHLKGRLQPWVASKDIILEMLRRLSVKGGVGVIFEYFGEGIQDLDVPARSTITNMGAELGATTSIFPSDEQTRRYLRAQGREEAWVELGPDPGAEYDEVMEIDLDQLEPLIARPQSPDNVVPVREVEGTPVAQVCVGSCTNSSYPDLMKVAAVLKGRTVHPNVSLTLTPGSRQVYIMIARSGALADFIAAGARILESACGPCIGMGQAPPTDAVSLRTFNRNFPGRSGTPNDHVYLCSPEVAAAAAITGQITDPRRLGDPIEVAIPEQYVIDDRMIIPPSPEPETVEIIRGPNIRPVPLGQPCGIRIPQGQPPAEALRGQVLLKVGDNITTDHILPAGARILPLRSNIPAISEYVYVRVDPTFPERARALKEKGVAGIVVGGENYGQGSSREHAALAPMYLGLKAVIARSFARIHWVNLINFGILPLNFVRAADYEAIEQGEELEIVDVRSALQTGDTVKVRNLTKGTEFTVRHDLTPRQVEIVLDGGLLNHIKQAA
ncbi:MAG: aconitate hydratase [Anaerolineae bacterium]